jgi:peptidoglycan lytic transglycosylase G
VVRLALVAACAALVVGVVAGCGGSQAPPPTTTVVTPFRVVFPEGFTRAQMAARVQVVAKIAKQERGHKVKLSAKTYRAATRKARAIRGFGKKKRPLEGFLFPATYDFLATTTSQQLVHAQLVAFLRDWGKLNLAYAESKNLTPYDVLTIASMIEREAQAPKERPLVAAVIYNRLRDGMTLGIDATLRYGLHLPPGKPLTQSDLASNNPYNTRNRTGLPPTPIANPGLASMEAAAHPAHVDYLYYVLKPDGTHHYFTANYQDFLQHEAAYGY